MNSYTNYHLNNYKRALDFEIKKLELQLNNSENKLQHARSDFKVYLGFIGMYFVVELFLYLLILYYQHQQAYLFISILHAIYFIIEFIFIISLPFNIYCLVKSISVLIMNSEKYNQDYLLPSIRHNHHGAHLAEDNTYLSEQKKILWVLGQYTLYHEKLNTLTEQVKEEEVTLEDLNAELSTMPFYEDIKPASPHNGRVQKYSRYVAKYVLIGLLLLFLITILFPILRRFGKG